MSKRTTDIQDDELRVIGSRRNLTAGRAHSPWPWIAAAAATLTIAAVLLLRARKESEADVPTVFEPVTQNVRPDAGRLGNYSDTLTAWTEHLRYTINDIELHIFIPHNASPVLQIGMPSEDDSDIILTAQAADIRADNQKINGAFVLAGKPLAWGLSKKGYVAIIDGKVSLGVSENSPLFEQATARGGYFFRQYALVDNGVLVENAPKGKSIRKAICERNGEIMVVVSETPESFHDFTQTLVDFGVNNAVYLVGSNSFGYWRDASSTLTHISDADRIQLYRNENYITWRK